MARLAYYVAQTLDGFIADPAGGVGFLDMFDTHGDGDPEDHGYGAFYEGIDSVVMGSGTYDVVLGFGVDWPYAGKPAWVMTQQAREPVGDDVHFSSKGPRELLAEIRDAGYSQTWLVGGGKLAAAFQNEGLLDQWIVSIAPYVLGKGIGLVAPEVKPTRLELTSHEVFPSGLVQLVYE